MEDMESGNARLEIHLEDWSVGEKQYNGVFSIDRCGDLTFGFGDDLWMYTYAIY